MDRSRWNTAEKCRFAIGGGILVPEAWNLLYYHWEPLTPEKADESHCLIRYVPKHETHRWWELGADDEATVDSRIIQEIQSLIKDDLLPFYERFRELKDVIDSLEYLKIHIDDIGRVGYDVVPSDSFILTHLGILYWLAGEKERACRYLREDLRATKHEWWQKHKKGLLKRLCSSEEGQRASAPSTLQEKEEAVSPAALRPQLKGRLNQILKQAVEPSLQLAGFKKRGTTYYKQLAELSALLKVACNWDDVSRRCDFALFYGIYVPQVLSIFDPNHSEPSLPTIDHCILWAGAGTLNPVAPRFAEGQKWWVLHFSAPLSADACIQQEVRDEVEQWGLPFLQRFQGRQDVIRYLENYLEEIKRIGGYPLPGWASLQPSDPWMLLGVLYWLEGDRERCCAYLEQAYQVAIAKGHLPSYVGALEDLYRRLCV